MSVQDDIITTQTKLAFTITEFCKVHSICVATYYNMRCRGEAPREMQVGSRSLISWEAAMQWRHEREQQRAVMEAPKLMDYVDKLEHDRALARIRSRRQAQRLKQVTEEPGTRRANLYD